MQDTATLAPPDQVLSIAIERLQPDPNQPRKTFSNEALARLAASIVAKGILQPLRVLDKGGGVYLIIFGESRFRAAKDAGLTHVPCVLASGKPSETDLLAEQLIENSVRDDIPPMQFARAIARLRSLKRCTGQAIAAELGISGSSVSKAEALLELPEEIQAMIESGSIAPTIAYELIKLPDAESQLALAREIAKNNRTREEVKRKVDQLLGNKKKGRPRQTRFQLKLGGVAMTLTKKSNLDELIDTLSRIHREAMSLKESGGELAELARLLRTP